MTANGFESADRSPAGHAWREDAACRGEPPERFTEPAGPDDLRQALATCASCPVRQTCLQTALTLERDADLGIWGGTTEATRRRIRDGRLSVDDALRRPAPAVERSVAEPVPARQVSSGSSLSVVTASSERLGEQIASVPADVPMLTVSRDKHGDYTDATGRVIIFRIHGEPPWMLMIDGRCHTRTRTLTAAQQAAWKSRHLVRFQSSRGQEADAPHITGRRGIPRRR
jgi:hypothetical protein